MQRVPRQRHVHSGTPPGVWGGGDDLSEGLEAREFQALFGFSNFKAYYYKGLQMRKGRPERKIVISRY